MDKDNKNSKADNTDKKLHISDVMGWVAIDDHLPERGDECWVCRKHGEIEMDLFDGDWWVNQTYGGVTHWQKVVKPPCP